MNQLKDRCKEARVHAGYKHVPPFAKKVGVAPAAIYFIESGKTQTLKTDTLHAYARVTGYNAEWLHTGRGPKNSDNGYLGEAVAFPPETWERLSPGARELVLSVAEFARTQAQSDETSLLSAYRACTPEVRSTILSGAQSYAALCLKSQK